MTGGQRVRWDEIYLQSCATWLPPVMPADEAVGRGLVDAVTVRRAQVTGVTVGEQSPPDMAVAAARAALARAGRAPGGLTTILHASSYHQGHDLWAPASYVQRRAAPGSRCPALEIRQTSNGGLACLQLAAATLTAVPPDADHPDTAHPDADHPDADHPDTVSPAAGGAVLITTADRFCLPGIDRWRSDPGTVLADGATAAVVTREPGFARLTALVSVGEPELEEMHRGDDPFGAVPFAARRPIDVGVTTRAYLGSQEGQRAVVRMAERQRESVDRALEEAKATLGDIDWVLLPHFGRRRLDMNYFRRFGIDPDRTTWQWSRGVGHLGAGDQIAGLAWLAEQRRLRPGDRVLMLGVGGGFTWSAAVLDIGDPPRW
ncbi:putative 3-oxoacyl-ACP synthase III [Actinoplanes missouriensis 431]|uniref:Putative 3-oxoacyl-ACP synthase III n=1 Tax=Actinoplanes missouriensis (strain ATCC 14538 / DSM 43046 / CBS 188.64 / JCM 3121 / NBRC 102363 / NCIMB 12654 / NRRL B-3342 / UNCC 431) TaxID=512565 RepID=I0HB78_ACTM4|nr:ketoacyl-ACP synthase III family protein [Actinoplanes missouriensis]BAL90265.1 putative 3-oxoacyl-ACP synthase III [Actinoplanes missouriensis 431]